MQRLARRQVPDPQRAVHRARRQPPPVEAGDPGDALLVALEHVEDLTKLFLQSSEVRFGGGSDGGGQK